MINTRPKRRPMPPWVEQRLELPRRILSRWRNWAKTISPPGFRGQSLYLVLKFWLRDVIAIDFTMRASAMAYDFFFALFPALIFLFSLLPYIPVPALAGGVEETIRNVLPQDTWQLVQPTVSNTVREGNPLVLLVSVLLLLFGATRGVRSMLSAFYLASPETFRRRNFGETLWVSFVIFTVVGLLFLLAMTLLVGGELVLTYLSERVHLIADWAFVLLFILTIGINLLLLYAVVAFLFYMAPAQAKKWHFFSPGTVLGGTLLFVAQLLLRLYFGGFANYNKLYGTLATVMILAVWIYYNCLVLLLGFELNTAIDAAEAHTRREREKALRRARRAAMARQLEEPTSTGRARRDAASPAVQGADEVADLAGWSPS